MVVGIVVVDVMWGQGVFAIGIGGWCWWVVVAVEGGGWLLLPFVGDTNVLWVGVFMVGGL